MSNFIPHTAPAKTLDTLPLMHPGRPVGRDEVFKTIYAHLQGGQAVLLQGAEGTGKTTIAAALASAYVQQSGGVLWLNGSVSQLAGLLVQVGRAYRATEITNSEQPAAMAGAVAGLLLQHKPFIVLENARDAFAIGQFIDKCAPKLPVLILSDQELAGAWQTVPLGKLADVDALTLFKQKAGITDDKGDIDCYGIAKIAVYAPFPLVLTARAMVAAKQTPAEFFTVYNTIAQTLKGDGTLAAIATSYRALNGALQGLILMMGATFTGEASLTLLAMSSGVPQDAIDQAMSILSQLYLVERFTRYEQPYYRLHPLVYQFAQSTLKGSNRLDALQAKVKESTLAYAKQFGAQGKSHHNRLAAEMDNFSAIASWASENGERAVANDLITTLLQADEFVAERGYVYELLRLRQLASGSTSAFPAYGSEPALALDDEDDDDFDSGTFDIEDYDEENYEDVDDEEEELPYKRDLMSDDGDDEEDFEYPDADDTLPPAPTLPRLAEAPETLKTDALTSIDIEQLRTALQQAKQQRDTPRTVQILKAIGKVQIGQGKLEEALATHNEILQLVEQARDENATLETLEMLAALLAKTGNNQAAVLHAIRGVTLAETLADSVTRLNLLITLGDARQELGELDNAVRAFEQALTLARETDDTYHEALALYKLGYAQLDNGDPDESIRLLEESRELFKAQARRDYEGRVMGGLGAAYAEQERWSEAIRYYKSSLYIAREVRDHEEEALQLSNLGQAQVQAKQLPDALLSYRQALHLAYQSNKRDNIVTAILDLARLMMQSNRLLGICQLLLQDAENVEPNDRDVLQLRATVEEKLHQTGAQGLQQAPVNGTARDYAANAYALLDG